MRANPNSFFVLVHTKKEEHFLVHTTSSWDVMLTLLNKQQKFYLMFHKRTLFSSLVVPWGFFWLYFLGYTETSGLCLWEITSEMVAQGEGKMERWRWTHIIEPQNHPGWERPLEEIGWERSCSPTVNPALSSPPWTGCYCREAVVVAVPACQGAGEGKTHWGSLAWGKKSVGPQELYHHTLARSGVPSRGCLAAPHPQ